MALPEVCIGCQLAGGSNLLATILSVVGVITGVSGAIISVLAYLSGQANYDANIFREEFDRHRVPLETSLQTIKRNLITLRSSTHPLLPMDTVVRNFEQAKREARQAVETILSEADDVDSRGLVKATWVAKLQPSQAAIEQAWDLLDDSGQPEAARRQAAVTIVAQLNVFTSETRAQIEHCVLRSLTRKRWFDKT
tara:strand:- start:696 stop:1280 length:585 start_codon:yes stop_codon:yes gene_type:complete